MGRCWTITSKHGIIDKCYLEQVMGWVTSQMVVVESGESLKLVMDRDWGAGTPAGER